MSSDTDARAREQLGSLRPGTTTLEVAIGLGSPGPGGYRRLVSRVGEPAVVRGELGGGRPTQLRSLISFVQLSDLHVMDAQSPARAEYLDREGDPDAPLAALLGRIGLYRPQESLTHQVVEAMARALCQVEGGPLTGSPVSFCVSTGDATDNCQENELENYLGLLDGGRVVTSAAEGASRYVGVGAPEFFHPRYWHPDGSPSGEESDLPHRRRGFPLVPGLLDASIGPLGATGLPYPWYAVYGNHDGLLAGTLTPTGELGLVGAGSQKRFGTEDGTDLLAILSDNRTAPPSQPWGLLAGPYREVAPDRRRRPVSRHEWVSAHLESPGEPRGHGLYAAPPGRAYYGFDIGLVRFLVLDTVNLAGGWQGSLDEEQFAWLEDELVGGSSWFSDEAGHPLRHGAPDRLFVLFSHHPLETLVNAYAPGGGRRVLAAEVEALLTRFPNVVCWVNGHTHANTITPIGGQGGRSGFWQVTTSSHVDWPQQSRVIELALDQAGGELVIGTAMIDHLGAVDPRGGELDDPLVLAGWSRELSANAWQGRNGELPFGGGRREDRNTIAPLPAPSFLRR